MGSDTRWMGFCGGLPLGEGREGKEGKRREGDIGT